MKYKIDHDYHIHTYLSSCSADPAQTVERIFRYGKKYGLEKLCITDHCWDDAVAGASDWYAPQNVEHVSQVRNEALSLGMKFGCETEMREDGTIGLGEDKYEYFDFLIIPTTHLHMEGFTIRRQATIAERKKAYLTRLDRLLSEDLPFGKIGIPHLATSLIGKLDNAWQRVLDGIDDKTFLALFDKAAQKGVGIELNSDDCTLERITKEEANTRLRVFRLAKEAGCKFYLGSDAHHPNIFDLAINRWQNVIDLLNLDESDKFYPSWA